MRELSSQQHGHKLTVRRQIAGSDIILLNKIDLASEQQTTETEAVIRQVNPAAIVHTTTRAQIDLDLILNVQAYGSRPIDAAQPAEEEHEHDHGPNEDCHCINHYQVRGISSLSLSCPALGTARFDRLDEWIRTVLWENRFPNENEGSTPIEILRCKGLFSVNGQQHVLQGVRDIYDIVPLDGNEVETNGKLVFIGRNLDEAAARRSLSTVLWD